MALEGNRITATFEALKKDSKTALIPYLTGGFPQLEWTVPLMHKLVEAGASIIEVGVPFSDPMADGPVIQQASERAIDNGASFLTVLEGVKEFRKTNTKTPIVLMGYLNSIEVRGVEVYAKMAAEAGADGVLTVDMPADSAEAYSSTLKSHGLAPIFLAAPTTSEERFSAIAERGAGFFYYVSLKGITGASSLDVSTVRDRLAIAKQKVDLPIAVGFGIKTAEQCADLAGYAEGVIVGSALVNLVDSNQTSLDECLDALGAYICELSMSLASLT